MTFSLPFEILISIFENVSDVRDLWNVRTASRTLCAAATPIAFRVLSVTSTAGSAQNIGRLFDLPDIAAHVREVSYCDKGDNRQGRTQRLDGGSSPCHPILYTILRLDSVYLRLRSRQSELPPSHNCSVSSLVFINYPGWNPSI
jgi:hypothetical protein